jgi:transposase
VLRSLARRHRGLDWEVTRLHDRMEARATPGNPALLAIDGVGPVVGAQLLITAYDNPDRVLKSWPRSPPCVGPRRSRSAPDAPTGTGSPAAGTATQGGPAPHRQTPMTNDYPHPHTPRRAPGQGWTTKAVYRALKRPSLVRSRLPCRALRCA